MAQYGQRAVTVNVVVRFGLAVTAAFKRFSPAPEPTVQLPTRASPLASVTSVEPVTVPPPASTLNVTETPARTPPAWFLTTTAGKVPTAVATRTVSLPPAVAANEAGLLSG